MRAHPRTRPPKSRRAAKSRNTNMANTVMSALRTLSSCA
nr:MAG TPA: hypothetical protein [Caudoviricetes sp.]